MIKFFRKIRQKMLTENNFSKYLLYAIGEIVLVVIGILIALQVNNWNEQRKASKETNLYKAKLINDLVRDTININAQMDNWIRRQKGIEAYFDFFDNQNGQLNQFLDSARRVPVNYIRYFPINLTFKDMQQSGKISLLSEEQRKALINLYSSQEFLIIIIDKAINEIKVSEHERNKFLNTDLSDSDFYSKISWEQSLESKRKGLLSQHHVLEGYYTLISSSTYRANIIKQQTKISLDLLNQ